MTAVLAGLLCGWGLALATMPLIALSFVRLRATVGWLRLKLPVSPSFLTLSLGAQLLAFIAFPGVGALLGLLFNALEARQPTGGLGSPNLAYTIFVLGLVIVLSAPPLIALPRARAVVGPFVLLGTGVFGWLLPYLAVWGASG